MLKLSIIGCGKLGRTLARLWAQTGHFAIQDVLNRSPASAQQAVEFVGAGRVAQSYADLQPADVFMIATPDEQIEACAQELAQTGRIRPENLVFHCSGALPASMLEAARQAGAAVASAHPVRSFAVPEQVVQSFAGTWCGIEGDARAVDWLTAAFNAIGGRPVAIKAEFKTLYHSAAVFASNYLVTLLDVAIQAYAKAGIPEQLARELMAPLVRETVENVLRLGPEQALTGPIARGDLGTAVNQYRAVRNWNKKHGALYKQLGKLTAELALRRKQGSFS